MSRLHKHGGPSGHILSTANAGKQAAAHEHRKLAQEGRLADLLEQLQRRHESVRIAVHSLRNLRRALRQNTSMQSTWARDLVNVVDGDSKDNGGHALEVVQPLVKARAQLRRRAPVVRTAAQRSRSTLGIFTWAPTSTMANLLSSISKRVSTAPVRARRLPSSSHAISACAPTDSCAVSVVLPLSAVRAIGIKHVRARPGARLLHARRTESNKQHLD